MVYLFPAAALLILVLADPVQLSGAEKVRRDQALADEFANGAGPPISEDEFRPVRLRGGGNLCLGVSGTNAGTPVTIFECDNDSDRLWKLDSDGLLILKSNPNRCAARFGSTSSTDNFINIERCSPSNDRHVWKYNSESGNEILSQSGSSKLCMHYSSLKRTGQNIYALTCSGSSSQEFDLSGSPDSLPINTGDTTTGGLVFVNNAEHCTDCIAMTGCPTNNYNCPEARLAIVDCYKADTAQNLLYWNQTPENKSLWCLRDADFCVHSTRKQGGAPELTLIGSTDGPDSFWYHSSNEIQPEKSDGYCVASNGNQVSLELCNSASLDRQTQWEIASYNQWNDTCDPLGRDPGSVPGKYIIVNSAKDCDYCIGINTRTGRIGMALCVDTNDEWDTVFAASKVPDEQTRWCLESMPDICIKYVRNDETATSGTDLLVVRATGSQNELWYFEAEDITPKQDAAKCIAWKQNREVALVPCSSVAYENRSWAIFRASTYQCNQQGISSFDATISAAAGLMKDTGRLAIYTLSLSHMIYGVLLLS